VFDQVEHARIDHRGDLVKAVEYRRFGRAYRAEADAVVVSSGAIGSSVVLLSSKVKSQKPIGSGFHMLGGVLVVADTKEPVDSFDGIGLTYMLNDTSEYVVETFFSPPAAFAASMNGFAATHSQRMQRYRHLSQAGVMVGLEPTGRITLDHKGETRLEYTISRASLEGLKKGMKQLSRIYFAGGAQAVYPGLYTDATLRSENDVASIDAQVKGGDDILFGSAHPQGGNPMSEDPKRGVVGNDFRVHGYKNLFVADASVFPTNLWANCQATVMAMAYLAADFVLARRPSPALSSARAES
jgi:choline dehydrogenase-like flavoprotein